MAIVEFIPVDDNKSLQADGIKYVAIDDEPKMIVGCNGNGSFDLDLTQDWSDKGIKQLKDRGKEHNLSNDTISNLCYVIGNIYVEKACTIVQILTSRKSSSSSSHYDKSVELGDESNLISVKEALFAKSGHIITVGGQITAKGKIHAMVRGVEYDCVNCGESQELIFQIPLKPNEVSAPSLCQECSKKKFGPKDYADFKTARMQLEPPRKLEIRAIKIELTDTEVYDQADTLRVMLFDEHAKDVQLGEHVIITGLLHTLGVSDGRQQQQELSSGTNSAKSEAIIYPTLYAHDVKYTKQDTYKLTSHDVQRVKRFIELAKQEMDPKTRRSLGENNIIYRLVHMMAQHIIWNYEAKEALLYVESSAGPDILDKNNNTRKRMNAGLVGNPGLGKTRTLELAKRYDERNRCESCENSSGKSFTAIVSKEGDSQPIIRTGAVAHARGAVCGLNELGEMDFEQQKHLQSVMEEGRFTINKNGMHAEVRADTAVVWTSNPVQGASFVGDKISFSEIPIRRQLLDRTDLLVIFRPITDRTQKEEHNRLRLAYLRSSPERKKILANYDDYVQIHLMYVKQFCRDITLTEGAEEILNQADLKLHEQKSAYAMPNAGSNRSLDILVRLTNQVARLKGKHEADETDARYAVEYFNKISSDMNIEIKLPEDPAMTAYHTIVYLLQNESNGLPRRFTDLAKEACKRDKTIEKYLKGNRRDGTLGTIRDNSKLQRVLKLLENLSGDGKIKRTNLVPAEFLWIGDQLEQEKRDNNRVSVDKSGISIHGDVCDERDASKNEGVEKIEALEPRSEVGQPDNHAQELQKQADIMESDPLKNNGAEENQSSQTSQTSPGTSIHISSITEDLKEVEDSELTLLLQAMDRTTYNRPDGTKQSIFHIIDVWKALVVISSPSKHWTKTKIEAGIQQLIKKGRVIVRSGDPPGQYHFIHSSDDNYHSNKGEQ
jgi:DNA replicative helicase MCM subunit Mcm2 (Cdc46/Mcm family)